MYSLLICNGLCHLDNSAPHCILRVLPVTAYRLCSACCQSVHRLSLVEQRLADDVPTHKTIFNWLHGPLVTSISWKSGTNNGCFTWGLRIHIHHALYITVTLTISYYWTVHFSRVMSWLFDELTNAQSSHRLVILRTRELVDWMIHGLVCFRARSCSRKPLRLAYDSLRLARQLAAAAA